MQAEKHASGRHLLHVGLCCTYLFSVDFSSTLGNHRQTVRWANFGPLAYDTDHDEVWNWVSPALAGPTACRPEELKAMSLFSTWASCGFLRFRRGASEPFRDCKAHFSCDSCAWSLDGSVGCFRQVPESCAFCMDWTAASSQVSHYAQLLAACRCLATRVSR